MLSTSSCNNRDAVFAAIDAAETDVSTDDALRWRLRSLRRCLQALERRFALADKGALIRQAAWLCDNHIDLPKAGWTLDLDALCGSTSVRFGVSLRSTADRWIATLLEEGRARDGWPDGLERGLGLDASSRRPAEDTSLDGALARLSPHPSYRIPTQKAAARALLTMPPGASLMVSMPTGAGKSLLFQLGALWWRELQPDHPACVVVVVPTVALALDHAQSLRAFPGLERSQALTGDLNHEEKSRLLTEFLRGEIPILVMNPETAFHSARETLERMCQPRAQRLGEARGELVAFIVDEAHIVESWGRSFRPDFQRMISLVERLRTTNPALRVVLLSATLGDEASKLLRQDYGKSGEWLELHACIPRYELDLFSRRFVDVQERDRVLFEILDRLPRPAILYTTTKADAARILARAQEREYRAVEAFTGDTEPAERTRILRAWRSDELDLVVATSAFGMGIDKADVRAVVHACLPEDAPRWYQEVGRAGRDGHRALGVCLWTEDDAERAKTMHSKGWLKIESSIERWNRIVELCRESERLRLDPESGRVVLEVDVNFAPERLGSHTGERNREWNRTLLNLMQRAGALCVLDVHVATNTWIVEILDGRILDGDQELLTSLFSLREDERRQAVDAFCEHHDVLRGEYCLLAETFRLLESGRPLASECGHCGPCLQTEQEPPGIITFGGLTAQWVAPALSVPYRGMPGTVLIEHSVLMFSELLVGQIPKLIALGYIQFMVPDERTCEVAGLLAGARGHPGLVLGFEEWKRLNWCVYDVPTAVLVDRESKDVYQQAFLRAHLERPRETRPPVIILACDGYCVDGRLLSQQVDSTYSLSVLNSLGTWGL